LTFRLRNDLIRNVLQKNHEKKQVSPVNLGAIIVRLARARRNLISLDFSDKERLLAASRRVDRLLVEYYRARYMGGGPVECSSKRLRREGQEEGVRVAPYFVRLGNAGQLRELLSCRGKVFWRAKRRIVHRTFCVTVT